MKTQNNLRHIMVMLVACLSCSFISSAKEGVAVFLPPNETQTFGPDTISTVATAITTGTQAGQNLSVGPITLKTIVSKGNYFIITNSYAQTSDSSTYIKKIFFISSVKNNLNGYKSLTDGVSFSVSGNDVTVTPPSEKKLNQIYFQWTVSNTTNKVSAIYVTYETEEPKEPEVEKDTWMCPLVNKNVDATWGKDLNLNDSLEIFLSALSEEYANYAENPPKVIYTITSPNDEQYELVGPEDDPDYKCVFHVLEPSDTMRCVDIQCSWDENDYWLANAEGGSFTVNILPTEDDSLKISLDEQSGDDALEASGTKTTIGRTGYIISVNKQADTNYYFYHNDDKENTCELTDTTELVRPGNYGDVSVLPGVVYTITVVAVKDGETSTATTEKFLTQPNIEVEDAPAAEQAVALAADTPTDKIASLKVAGAETKIFYSIGDGTNEAAAQEYTEPVRVNVGEHITYYAEADGLTSPKVVYAPQDITVSAAVIIDENVAPEYYDMQGRRVDTTMPAPGIYIRKTSNSTVKIIIR